MLITRRVEFSASHSCYSPQLSEEENRALYGESAGSRGHGHNYVLEVTLEGEPDPLTGMIFDLKRLKHVVNREVVEPMDHRHLNHEVPPFDRVIPTAENLVREIWRRLEPHLRLPNGRLHTLRLYETSDLYVDYAGEDA
ncbi:MAG: 6-carboxytetrahydropterin synthase [Acidobacteria bacterium]|nr:6-carboxytetrahydropterin synthase [Acidobacteriota bacterium]MBI3281906.1 6-carboxytetrahydropterin synthase [Acidobacteriota bacterium]